MCSQSLITTIKNGEGSAEREKRRVGGRWFLLEQAYFGKFWLKSRLIILNRQGGKNQELSENKIVFCQICVRQDVKEPRQEHRIISDNEMLLCD